MKKKVSLPYLYKLNTKTVGYWFRKLGICCARRELERHKYIEKLVENSYMNKTNWISYKSWLVRMGKEGLSLKEGLEKTEYIASLGIEPSPDEIYENDDSETKE